jgi:hypothetical protein
MAKGNKQPNGSYVTYDNGRIVRFNGMLGPTESIDTTGYGSGKKDFDLRTSIASYNPVDKKVKREDVPKIISELKEGATRFEDYRSAKKKKSGK